MLTSDGVAQQLEQRVLGIVLASAALLMPAVGLAQWGRMGGSGNSGARPQGGWGGQSTGRSNAWGQSGGNRMQQSRPNSGGMKIDFDLGSAVRPARPNNQGEGHPTHPSHQPSQPNIGKIFKDITTAIGSIPSGSNHPHHPHHPHGTHSSSYPSSVYPSQPFYPQPSYTPSQPSYTPPATNVVESQPVPLPPNTLPANQPVEPQPNPLVSLPVKLLANDIAPTRDFISRGDAQAGIDEAKQDVDQQVQVLKDNSLIAFGNELKRLGVPEDHKKALLEALAKGEDTSQLTATMPEFKAGSPAAKALETSKEQFKQLDSIAEKAKQGTLTPTDIADYWSKPGFSDNKSVADTAALQIAADSGVINSLQNLPTTPDAVPPTGDATIIAVGAMGAGEVIPINETTVMMGTGVPDQGICIGQGNVSQLCGMSVGTDAPLPESTGPIVERGVLLRNAASTGVSYNLNDQPFQMEPGYRQELPGGRAWTATFDRGGSFGQASYSLSDGTYEFRATDQGWELYRQDIAVTIDNSLNRFDFQYVVNNEQQKVPAHQKLEHQGAYPLQVRFDNGRGGERQKTLESGAYSVAVSPEGTLELYDQQDVAPPVRLAATVPPKPKPGELAKDPRKAISRVLSAKFTPKDGSTTVRTGDASSTAGKRISLFAK